MKRGTWLRIGKVAVGSVAALLLLAWVGFWCVRIGVWHDNVKQFYSVPLDDGPYVFREGGKLRIANYEFVPPKLRHWRRVLRSAWSQQMDGSYRVHEQILELTNRTALDQALARHPGLELDLASAPQPQAAVYTAARVAALSDVHGSARHLKALLQGGGIVDPELNWQWGSGRLVVAGDVVDKGPAVIEALWLLRKLERQAAAAGGGVHVLLGNHETMLLAESNPGSGVFYHGRKYQVLARAVGVPYGQLFGRTSELGNWLRTRNTVVQINDVIFVHGGFSRALLQQNWSLEAINGWGHKLVNEGLPSAGPNTRTNLELLASYWGPYEYKGYFDTIGYMEQFDESVITDTLQRYQCRLLVVGHAAVRSIQTVRGGRVVAIAVKLPETDIPAPTPAGELLLLEGQQCLRVRSDGTRQPL
ncbi:MAG TPA: metallophosphoesterase [Verrucomicrobiae bacterium]